MSNRSSSVRDPSRDSPERNLTCRCSQLVQGIHSMINSYCSGDLMTFFSDAERKAREFTFIVTPWKCPLYYYYYYSVRWAQQRGSKRVHGHVERRSRLSRRESEGQLEGKGSCSQSTRKSISLICLSAQMFLSEWNSVLSSRFSCRWHRIN